MKRLAVLAFLCLVAVPAFAAPADDAMAHSKAFERAVNARDAKAILALYAPDAHVIWPGQGEEANGKAGIEKLVANFVKELPKTRSAKVMRRVIRAAYLGDTQGDLSALENPQAVAEIARTRG